MKSRIHKVNKNVWYVKCKKCEEWFKYKPNKSRAAVFCDPCKRHKRFLWYINARDAKILAEKIVSMSSSESQ